MSRSLQVVATQLNCTFGIACPVAALLRGRAGVVHTVQSVVAGATTQFGAAVTKDDLTWLQQQGWGERWIINLSFDNKHGLFVNGFVCFPCVVGAF